MVKRVSDIIGTGEIDFYPALDRKGIETILNRDVEISDAKILRGWDGEFGKSDWSLLLIQDLETKEQFTTKCGGIVFVRRLQQLLDAEALPIVGCISWVQGKFPYYQVK